MPVAMAATPLVQSWLLPTAAATATTTSTTSPNGFETRKHPWGLSRRHRLCRRNFLTVPSSLSKFRGGLSESVTWCGKVRGQCGRWLRAAVVNKRPYVTGFTVWPPTSVQLVAREEPRFFPLWPSLRPEGERRVMERRKKKKERNNDGLV